MDNTNEINFNNNDDNQNNNSNFNKPPPLPVLPNEYAQGPLPQYDNIEEKTENSSLLPETPDTLNSIFTNNSSSEANDKKTLGNIINEDSITEQSIDSSGVSNPSVEFNQMLNRVMASDIPREDKIKILLKFKADMLHPEKGEQRELENLESQYSQLTNPNISIPGQSLQSLQSQPYQQPQQPQQQMLPQQPQQPQQEMLPQQYMYAGQQPYYSPYQMQPPNFGYMMPYQQQSMQPQQTISTQQFEILKNKLDTIQLEMIDVVRHLKDYSKKYMMAVRQDDMSKLDTYVRDLINVDKKLEDTQNAVNEQREEFKEAKEEIKDVEDADNQSIFGKATSGMKGMMGSIGKNIGSVSDLVKNTASATNDMLKKNILPTNETPKEENKPNNNIMSVDQYVNEIPDKNPTEIITNTLPEQTPETAKNTQIEEKTTDEAAVKPIEPIPSAVDIPPIGESIGNVKDNIDKPESKPEPEKKLQDEINALDKEIKTEISKNIGTEVQTVQQGGGGYKTKKKKNLKNRKKTPKTRPKKTKKKLRK